MFIHCLFAFGAGIWNYIWGNETWFNCPWRNIYLNWSCFDLNHTVACANKPCRVIYVNVKLLRNQSWVSLLFSVSWDLILDLILYNLFSIFPLRGNQEPRKSRHATDCQLQCKTSDQLGIFEDTYYIYLKPFPKVILKRHVLS